MLCEKKKIDSLVWPSWILILLFSDINSIILDLRHFLQALGLSLGTPTPLFCQIEYLGKSRRSF